MTLRKLALFAQLRKVDEAKHLVIARAVQEVVDKSDEIFDYATSRPYFEAWSNEMHKASGGKSYGNVRAMHGKSAAGIVAAPLTFIDDEKAIDVAIKVVDDQDWAKVLEGCYTGVSIGGSYVGERTAEKIDGRTVHRYTAKPVEISLVDNPCVPTAQFFDIIKADGTVLQKAFAVADPELTVNGTGEEIAELAKRMNDAGVSMRQVIDSLVAGELFKSGPGSTPHKLSDEAYGATSDAKTAVEHRDAAKAHDKAAKAHAKAGNDDIADHHGKMSELHSTAADHAEAQDDDEPKKAAKVELRKADATAFGDEIARYMLATIDDVEKREFSSDERKAAAKKGHALPDGSFPINSVADLKNAVHAYGRAKDKEAAKAHIIKRAKALGATAELPEDWTKGDKANTAGALRKGMYDVRCMADFLEQISYLARSTQYETEVEGDASPIPAQLRNWVDDGIAIFKALAAEEADELLASLKAAAGVGEDDEIELAVENAVRMGALRKRLGSPDLSITDLTAIAGQHGVTITKAMLSDVDGLVEQIITKAGARHSAADKAHLQAAHDHLASMGADCSSDKSAGTGNLAKGGDIEKRLETALARIDELEKQPMPHAVVLKLAGQTRPISKGDDNRQQQGNLAEEEIDPNTLVLTAGDALVKNADGTTDYHASRIMKARRLEREQAAAK
jgi:hypothetical protein